MTRTNNLLSVQNKNINLKIHKIWTISKICTSVQNYVSNSIGYRESSSFLIDGPLNTSLTKRRYCSNTLDGSEIDLFNFMCTSTVKRLLTTLIMPGSKFSIEPSWWNDEYLQFTIKRKMQNSDGYCHGFISANYLTICFYITSPP